MLGHYQLFSDSDAPKFRGSRCVNMTFVPHMHHQYEFVYMLDGEMETTIEDQTRLLHPGDICLSLSNKIHRYYTPNTSLCCMVIFEPEQTASFTNLMKKRDFATPFFHDAEHKEEYDQIATAMLREACQHGCNPDPLVLKGYMTVFLGRIYQNASFIPRSNSTSALQQVLEYISAHFTEPLSLNTLADSLNFSKYYVSRIFNQQLGYSFCHYLKYLRINHALSLLEKDALSISDISYECGFESLRSFNRSFQEILETTPTAYRDSRREQKTNAASAESISVLDVCPL